MLSIMRSNAKARAEAEGAKVKLVAASGRRKIVSAGPALRLLDIAAPFHRSDTLGLLPWVVDLLRSRGVGESLLKEMQPHFRADEQGAQAYCLSDDPDYHLPEAPRSPEASWFPKGHSGNPAGRPARRQDSLPFEGFLQEEIIVRIDDIECRLTRLEALLYHLQRMALKGDEKIAMLLAEASVAEQNERWKRRGPKIVKIAYEGDHQFGSDPFTGCLIALRIVNRRTRKHVLLEPWIVEAALSRLPPDALDEEEQAVVMRSTSTPHKVAWPAWWSKNLRVRQRVGRREGRVRTRVLDSWNW